MSEAAVRAAARAATSARRVLERALPSTSWGVVAIDATEHLMLARSRLAEPLGRARWRTLERFLTAEPPEARFIEEGPDAIQHGD